MLRRFSHIILEAFIATLAVGVLLGAAGAWRLSQGPVSLTFLTPYIQEALAQRDDALRFEVDDTVLTWAGWKRALDIRGTGARMTTPEGRIIASVPEISISLSFRAMLRGVLAPTSLEIINPRVRLVRTAQGEFKFGFGDEAGMSEDILPGVLAALSAPVESAGVDGLIRRVSIVGGKLTVDDRMLGVTWGAPHADIELAREGRRLRAGFDLDVGLDDSGQGRTPRLQGTATYFPGGDRVRLETDFDNLRPASLVAHFPRLAPLRHVSVLLNGHAELEVDLRGTVLSASYRVGGGEGRLYEPELLPQAINFLSIRARGGYEQASNQLVLDRLTLDLGGPMIDVSGLATRVGTLAAISGKVEARNLPVEEIKRYWPAGFGPGARAWVRANMEGGTGDARVNLFARAAVGGRFRPVFDSLSATLNVRNSTVHYLKPLPPVRNTSATLVFGPDRVDIAIHGGDMNGLSVSQGTLAFTDIDRDDSWLDLELVLRGPLRNALEVLDHPRLRFIREMGLDAAAVEGVAATRLITRLPLLADLELSQVEVRAASNMRGVVVPGLLFGRPLTDGALELRLDNEGMSVSGRAAVGGARADVTWYENFRDDSAFLRRYDLSTVLDETSLAALGLDVSRSVRGPMEIDLVYLEDRDATAAVTLKLGLDETEILLPVVGWSKRAREPGAASLDVRLKNGRLAEIRKFDILSETLRTHGEASFADDGRTLLRADVPEFVVVGRTEVSIRATRRSDGGLDMRLSGNRVDAQPFIRSLDGSEEIGFELPALDIKANIRKMKVRPKVTFNNVEVSLTYDGTRWSNVFAVSLLGRNNRVGVGYIDRGDELKFSMESTDAGEALRTLGVVDNLVGGNLEVTASRTRSARDSPWRGTLKVRDVSIIDAPTLARLLSLASLTGISDVLAGRGLKFSRLDLPFSLTSKRLQISNARAVGSAIGITADGAVDLVSERVGVKGTIVPAYTINSLIGNIPILGTLITGERGGGIFAATYTVEGPLEQPRIFVNPLAALAPGFLRNLLRGLVEGGAPLEPLDPPVPD